MKRDIADKLDSWRLRQSRKPLILNGARQIGKTFSLRDFGARAFRKCHYLNFEREPDLNSLWSQSLAPEHLLQKISLRLGDSVQPEVDLLIFDEIQSCPSALTSLKYFSEDLPQLHIAAAGSLLGLHLGKVSFPVGKVDFLDMFPMSFLEFLNAVEEGKFIQMLAALVHDSLANSNSQGTVVLHGSLWELWKAYLVTGGLPEVVATFVEHKDSLPHALSLIRAKQEDLVRAYLADVAKHSGKVNSMHIERVLQNIPNQMLAEINASASKFQFKDVVPGIHNFSRLAPAIDWLVRAGLALPVPIAYKGEQPLRAFTKENAFKLFLFDVGMLGAIAFLHPATVLNYSFGTYKGFFAENFAVQELRTSGISPIYSWHEGSSEVEFLVTTQSGDLLPIEVKSGHRTHVKSLKVFMQKYRPKRSIIFSGNEVCSNNSGLIRLPIYTVGLVAKTLAHM